MRHRNCEIPLEHIANLVGIFQAAPLGPAADMVHGVVEVPQRQATAGRR